MRWRRVIVTIEMGADSYDIQADEQSSILHTLQILAECSMLPISMEELPQTVYSIRKKRWIPVNNSYRENRIYQGDVLRIEGGK